MQGAFTFYATHPVTFLKFNWFLLQAKIIQIILQSGGWRRGTPRTV
jgi:hypothetical protein